jgi:hypothetical protein
VTRVRRDAAVPVAAVAGLAAAAAAGQEPDHDDGDDRHPRDVEEVTAEQGEHRDDGEDGDRGDWHAGGPGSCRAGRGGAGGAGPAHGGLAPRQVGEQVGQVGGGAGLQGAAAAVLEFLGGEAAGLVVLAELGDGPVAVGVGHAQAAGRVARGGGTHVLNATDRRARGHRPGSGDPDIHPWVESAVNPATRAPPPDASVTRRAGPAAGQTWSSSRCWWMSEANRPIKRAKSRWSSAGQSASSVTSH